MYLLPQCGDSRGYFPINTKWGGESSLQGLLPGGGLRGLGYFRPNFAMNRGNYPGSSLSGMDAIDLMDPTTLAVGAGAVLLGWMLLKKFRGGGNGNRKIAHLAARRALAQRQLKDMGAA